MSHKHFFRRVSSSSGASAIIGVADTQAQWLHFSADLLIAIAFTALALAFFHFLRQRKDLVQTKSSLVLLAVLLVTSAFAHLAEACSWWQPIHLVSGILKGITAITSVLATIAIWPLIPRLLKVPSPQALQRMNLKLQREITERIKVEEELKQHRELLESQVHQRTQTLNTAMQRMQGEVEKRMEAQEQVSFQALLLNQLESAIVAVDINHRITYWNQYAETLFGWQATEVIGQPWQQVLIAQESKKGYKRHTAQLTKNKRWEGSVEMVHKNHQLLPVHASSTVLNGAEGEDIGYAFVCFDMSSQVRSKNRLQRAKDKAEKAAVAKQDFMSTMSHEIRTPLNVMMGMTRLLMDSDPRPKQVEYLKSLQFSANNLLVIINDILDFSKIEAGKVKLEEINFSVREVVEGVVNSFVFQAEEKKIALKYTIDEEVPQRTVGDQVRLTQVLNNLVSNAIKFTEQGFVSIYVKSLGNLGEQTNISFEVRDSGIGISQNKIRTIFNSFTQAATDTTRKFGGTGLGLTICKKLVELQNGNIQVKSKEGIGSTFSFTLPYLITEESGAQPVAAEGSYQLDDVHLLLVEDNPANRMVASSFLEKTGVRVTVAENGRTALEKVEQSDFDIVLMDLQMPEMDGYEATQAIRSLGGKYQDLPVVALTADVVSDAKDRVIEAGMNGYLSKPFSPDALYRTISNHLNRVTSSFVLPEEGDVLTLYDIVNKYNGDAEFVSRLLTSLRNSLMALPDEVADLVERKELHELRRLIHKIIPSVHMVENEELYQQLEAIKSALIADRADETALQSRIRLLRKSTNVSLAYIDRMSQQLDEQVASVTTQ